MVNYIRNLKIRLKLYVLIGVALLGLLIIGGMSFILMGRMNSMASDISTSWLPSINVARDMSTTISNIRLNGVSYRNFRRGEEIQPSVPSKRKGRYEYSSG